MNITESIRLSFESLKSNKLRSFLTMLGIIIGISAVITITTIGNSLQKTIASTMRELGGTNLIYAYVSAITPEFETDAEWEAWQYPEMTKDEQLTYERLSEFQTDFADRVEAVVVEEMLISAASSTGDKSSAKVSVNGVTPGYLSSSKLTLIAGRDIRVNLEDDRIPSADRSWCSPMRMVRYRSSTLLAFIIMMPESRAVESIPRHRKRIRSRLF